MRNRVDRDALVPAAQQCDRFAEKILPEMYEWQKAVGKAGGTTNRWPMNDQEFAWASFVDPKAARMWIDDPKIDSYAPGIEILNEMEAFAVYFIKGAADETAAFPSTGKVFCASLETLAPILVVLRERAKADDLSTGHFENAVGLYKLWFGRVQRDKLERDAKALDVTVEGEKKVIKPLGA
jgi:hypothetical protein